MAPATTRISTAAMAVAVVIAMILAAAVERAEAGQNCMCECVKLCMRTHIPAMDGCKGKCRENSCIESCSTACVKKGFPKPPNEGIPTCEIEPLSADEQHMLHH